MYQIVSGRPVALRMVAEFTRVRSCVGLSDEIDCQPSSLALVYFIQVHSAVCPAQSTYEEPEHTIVSEVAGIVEESTSNHGTWRAALY